MGQKVNPTAFRLGIVRSWHANWYADRKDFAKTLLADTQVRDYLKQHLAKAGLASILIERPAKSMSVSIQSSRPGVVIGKKGQDVGKIQGHLSDIAGVPVKLKILEVKKPNIDAQLIAEGIASQLERRVLFRRAMRRAMQSAMRGGIQGIKVKVKGRLGGAEIARAEWYKEGRIPLHTLRADIDYATYEAKTTYGVIGVKVWVFKGEILKKRSNQIMDPTVSYKSETKKDR